MLPCEVDPNAYFSDDPADIERAKEACQDCPLSRFNACRAAGWQNEHGVFGGLSADDRSRIDPERMRAVIEANKHAAKVHDWTVRHSVLITLTLEGEDSRTIGEHVGKSPDAVRMLQREGRKLGVLPGVTA